MTTPTVPGGPLYVDERMGYVWINGILLTAGWGQVTDPKPLWRPADARGTDELVPNVAGLTDYDWIETGSQRDVPFTLNGYVLHSGGAPSTPTVGLETNWFYLQNSVCSRQVLRSIAVMLPSGGTRTGWGKVTDFEPEDQAGPIVVGKLKIFLPDGQLA